MSNCAVAHRVNSAESRLARAQYLSTGHYAFIADGVYDFGSEGWEFEPLRVQIKFRNRLGGDYERAKIGQKKSAPPFIRHFLAPIFVT